LSITTSISKSIECITIWGHVLFSFLLANGFSSTAQIAEKIAPIFQDGEAQIVPAFQDSSKWIRHDLWIETTFDTDTSLLDLKINGS